MISGMKIVVNADDFGMSHSKNVAIDKAMREGLCTQTSLVVNLPCSEEAMKLAKDGGYMDRVSLHLNLTVGKPLTEKIKKCRYYCEDGEFLFKPVIKSYKQILPMHINCIRNELEAQIVKFIGFGFHPIRIDSHNWVHLRVPVWLALIPLIKKYNFFSVRPMWEGYLEERIAAKWYRYFKKFQKWLLLSECVRIFPYSSNIEQFLIYDEHRTENISTEFIAEVFTHPDIQKNEIMDTSSSYLKLPFNTLQSNVMQLCMYEKTNFYELYINNKGENI